MAAQGTQIWLHNTLTRSKEPFTPIDPANVRMYVCGPTVYDFAHIGNARPVIVFDVLYRLLRHVYGEAAVTYVRNITDVDDKINARAARDFPALPLNDAIRRVTEKTAAQFQADARALGALEPDVQPRATDNIEGMQKLIADLISKSHAYTAEGEVLFEVASMEDYGQLSGRKLEDQLAGARVAVDAHKRNPADFVLWKQSSVEEPGWDSPWGRGRPGWHIECSAMSERYLGQTFDIHGGGLDLIFPHHENEIAQSRCAHGTHAMANVWMHNGFVQVEGQKMSKSLGNFVTINELLETDKFGGRKWPGDVLRLAMLMTHYREPIDFSVARLEEASALIDTYYLAAHKSVPKVTCAEPTEELISILADDLATPAAVQYLTALAKHAGKNESDSQAFANAVVFLGVFRDFKREVAPLAEAAGAAENWHTLSEVNRADWLRRRELDLEAINVVLNNASDFQYISESQSWSEAGRMGSAAHIVAAVEQRLMAFAAKDFARADAIRNELLGQGVQLMDYKDPESGERRTKWELKR